MDSSHELERCKHELDACGYCLISKDSWGKEIDQMITDGYRPDTTYALEVYAESTYKNEIICKLLTNINGPQLSAILWLSQHPGNTPHTPLGSDPDPQGLVVQMWSSNSKGKFYKGSHLQKLTAFQGDHTWLQFQEGDLDHNKAEEISHDGGALMAIDPRLAFSVSQGTSLSLPILSQDSRQRHNFKDIKFPNRPGLEVELGQIREQAEKHNLIMDMKIIRDRSGR